MPKCKNDKTKSYKGTEPSPKGIGYCAAKILVGTKKRGLDNNMWIIQETKTGTKRWVKMTNTSGSKTATIKSSKSPKAIKPTKPINKQQIPLTKQQKSAHRIKDIFWDNLEKYYNIPKKKIDWKKWTRELSAREVARINLLTTKVKDELEDNSIKFIIVPLPIVDGIYWMDYVWNYIDRDLHHYEGKRPDNFIAMIIKLDKNDKIVKSGKVIVNFNHNLTNKNGKLVYNILKKYLGPYVKWNGSRQTTIDII